MSNDLIERKKKVLNAARKAVDELIQVLNDNIIGNDENDLSADKMKNAAAAKRLAFDDAIHILNRIEDEENRMDEAMNPGKKVDFSGVESKAKSNGRKV